MQPYLCVFGPFCNLHKPFNNRTFHIMPRPAPMVREMPILCRKGKSFEAPSPNLMYSTLALTALAAAATGTLAAILLYWKLSDRYVTVIRGGACLTGRRYDTRCSGRWVSRLTKGARLSEWSHGI